MIKLVLIVRLIFARSYVVATQFEACWTIKLFSKMDAGDMKQVSKKLVHEADVNEILEMMNVSEHKYPD